jgi:hypothetical protein
MRAYDGVMRGPYGTLSSRSNGDAIQPKSLEGLGAYLRPVMAAANTTNLSKWTDILSLRRNKRDSFPEPACEWWT